MDSICIGERYRHKEKLYILFRIAKSYNWSPILIISQFGTLLFAHFVPNKRRPASLQRLLALESPAHREPLDLLRSNGYESIRFSLFFFSQPGRDTWHLGWPTQTHEIIHCSLMLFRPSNFNCPSRSALVFLRVNNSAAVPVSIHAVRWKLPLVWFTAVPVPLPVLLASTFTAFRSCSAISVVNKPVVIARRPATLQATAGVTSL